MPQQFVIPVFGCGIILCLIGIYYLGLHDCAPIRIRKNKCLPPIEATYVPEGNRDFYVFLNKTLPLYELDIWYDVWEIQDWQLPNIILGQYIAQGIPKTCYGFRLPFSGTVKARILSIEKQLQLFVFDKKLMPIFKEISEKFKQEFNIEASILC